MDNEKNKGVFEMITDSNTIEKIVMSGSTIRIDCKHFTPDKIRGFVSLCMQGKGKVILKNCLYLSETTLCEIAKKAQESVIFDFTEQR